MINFLKNKEFCNRKVELMIKKLENALAGFWKISWESLRGFPFQARGRMFGMGVVGWSCSWVSMLSEWRVFWSVLINSVKFAYRLVLRGCAFLLQFAYANCVLFCNKIFVANFNDIVGKKFSFVKFCVDFGK